MSWTYLAEANLTSSNTITFNSIPQSYTDLKFICYVKSVSSGDSVSIRFNGDTGGNYAYANNYALYTGGTMTVDQSRALTYIPIGALSGPQTNMYELDIFQYANTTDFKQTKNSFVESAGEQNIRIGFVNGMWFSTAAITSVTFRADAGTLGNGTKIALYGIKAA